VSPTETTVTPTEAATEPPPPPPPRPAAKKLPNNVDDRVRQCVKAPELDMAADHVEIQLFKSVVEKAENINKTYFEWGTGGSTTIAAPWFGKSVAVENAPAWCSGMYQNQRVQCAMHQGRLNFACVAPSIDLAAFGYPRNPKDLKEFGPYFGAIGNWAAKLDLKYFDVIHVDGRYRVMCALEALDYMGPDSLLLIHDFWNRPHYHSILKFFDANPRAHRYGVLKKKSSIDKTLVDREKKEFYAVAAR